MKQDKDEVVNQPIKSLWPFWGMLEPAESGRLGIPGRPDRIRQHIIFSCVTDVFRRFNSIGNRALELLKGRTRSGSVCLNNFPRTISEALGVHNSAELSTAADGACDVPADAVGNSGRTNMFHSMQPAPTLADSRGTPHRAFDLADWSAAVACCTSQYGVRSGSVHQPRWHRHACKHART